MRPVRSRMLRALEKVFTLKTALFGLCTRGAASGAYLVINARHDNAPFISVIPLITANAGTLTFITKTWKSFFGRCRAIFCESGSDSRHTHVWARRGAFTCQYRWNVRGQQRHEAFHHEAPLAPFVLLSTVDWRLASFCSSSSVAAIVTLIVRES